MYKIRKITFRDHPILKNLVLDFCGADGKAVDTIIIAGENGTGKSTILDYIYNIMNGKVMHESMVEVESASLIESWVFYKNSTFPASSLWVKTSTGMDTLPSSDDFKKRYNATAIFSDVDINFQGQDVSSVTSLDLDTTAKTRRSSNDLPKQIKQLIIDIQAMDAEEITHACLKNPTKSFNELNLDRRMPRFTNAFSKMFDMLTFDRIENRSGHKKIVFKKNGVDIDIDHLSSGEKQIVYRGCFLLKDVNAMNGAFVFIDEPEISLHPTWQMKIMDYYKGIFTNADGKQTSQIFAVTHSPFIIHNENRKNDKVIVLARDDNGDIIVKDKAEYFRCDSIEAVQDAFSISNFSTERSVVYLEGRTDEKYFKKAIEVFGYDRLPFEFRWVGYMKNDKDEENTGKDALNKAAAFLIGRALPVKNICLFDCDTARQESEKNNVYIRVIPTYANAKRMRKGVENALILDSVDIEPYYSTRIKEGDYGDDSTIVVLEKMNMCNAICAMKRKDLKIIMANLRTIIDSLVEIFEEA